MSPEPRFALDTGHYLANTCYFIASEDRALVGLLNSRVSYFYFKIVCAGLEGPGETYLRFFGQYLNDFPLPSSLGRKLASLVAQAEEAAKAGSSERLNLLERQIDREVYALYNLTDAEIRIVEEATADQA